MNGLVWAALGLIFVSIFLAPLAFAGIALNTIDPVAIVADNGHHVIVTGPIACTQGEQAFLRVTVTQRTTGALAEGHTRIICTGDTQQWEVHGSSQRQETFQEAIATAVAVPRALPCIGKPLSTGRSLSTGKPLMRISGWSISR